MMNLVLKEVATAEDLSRFIGFPDELYKGCRYYVPMIHRHQRNTLSRDKNPAFSYCDARYWLVLRGEAVVGRVAGIINRRYNEERHARYVRFGWLDFVEEEDVLGMLLHAVESWGIGEGMKEIHGPLGFISFDPSGILVDGFDELPTSWGRYNYPYYGPMLEKFGYRKDVDWVEMEIRVPEQKPEREVKVARLVKKRYALRQATLRSGKDILHYAGKLFHLINSSYQGLYAFSSIPWEQAEALAGEFVHLIDPDCVSVVLNEQDDVVAFGLVMPSLSEAMQKAKGRLFPFGFLHIWRALRSNDTVDMLLLGVDPAYQNRGAHALVFEKITHTLYRRRIRFVETTRELEQNWRIQQLWANYEKRQHKRARCYVRRLPAISGVTSAG